MTINRTTLLDLPLPVTGTESGTWGDIVNNGLSEYIDISVAGSLSLSADSDTNLSSTEGNAAGTNIGSTTAQYAILRCTGARTATRNINAPAWAISGGTLTNYSKIYIVVNETTGSQNIVLRATDSATPTYTTGVTIVPGERAVCAWNGSDFVKVGGAAGGSTTQIQFNNAGVFGGSANLTWDGTNVQIGAAGALRLADTDSSNYVAFKSPGTVASNVTWTLPSADGTNGQALTTNGSGTLAFSSVTTSPGGSTTQVQYNNAGAFGGISNATTDGTTLSMTSPKVITGINDTNGNELLKVTATASAVNELTLANAATGGNPVLSATGGDTNIGITLTPKGTGGVVFPAGAVGTPAITTTGDTNTGVYFPGADSVAITTGGTAAVTVDSGQRTKFPTTIGIGNATPSTSGSGITFPATQSASSDANTLDDYEEGTFNAGIAFGGNAVGVTYASQAGAYVKTGRMVWCSLCIQTSSKGSSTGNFTITGLPFTSSAVNSYFAVASEGLFAMTGASGGAGTANVGFYSEMGGSSTSVTCYFKTAAANAWTNITDADVTNTMNYFLTICYQTST